MNVWVLIFFCLGLGCFYPSINLNVDFFTAAKEGEIVIVRTQIIKQGKSIINIKADVFNDNQRLVAQASSNLADSDIKILRPRLVSVKKRKPRLVSPRAGIVDGILKNK